MRFRCDIEGLRGYSIAMVILFHYYPAIFVNGVYGVDILFVVSGFVITNCLYSPSFACIKFYQRRINRLCPAAFLCLFWILLDSVTYIKTISLLLDIQAASIFVGNIRFYISSTNYFDLSKKSPLLHFWSLSIENQFYIFYPFLYILFNKIFKYVIIFIIGLSYSLLYFNYKINIEYTYFLIDTRIWELLLGCLSYIIHNQYKISSNVLSYFENVYIYFIISTIFYKYFCIPGPFTLFYTVFPIIVCINGKINKKYSVLSNTIIRLLGRISYSLYLFHYPILSSLINTSLKILACFIISLLSYYLIERTFRNINISSKANFILLFIAILSVNYLSYRYIKRLKNKAERNKYSICSFNIIIHKKCIVNYKLIKYIMYGDSHLHQYINVIKYFINKPTILFFSYFWHIINNNFNIIHNILKIFKNIEIIFTSFIMELKLYNISHKNAEILLNRWLNFLTNYSKIIVYIHDNPVLHFDPVIAVKNGLSTFEIGKNASLNIFKIYNSKIIIFNPFLILCPNYHICNLTYNTYLVYHDNNHLNERMVYLLQDYFNKKLKKLIIYNSSILYICELREFRFMNKENMLFVKRYNYTILHHLLPQPLLYKF